MKNHRNQSNENRSSHNAGNHGMQGMQHRGSQGRGTQGPGQRQTPPRDPRPAGNGYGEMNWEGDEFESRNQGFRGGSGTDWSDGRYAGRGPKGYTRSDERIKEEISDELTAHGGIDASNCTVEVSDGEVTLEGEVESREMKRAIEDVAEACSGVKQVHNRLRVSGNGNGQDSGRGSRVSGSSTSSSQGDGSETSSYASSRRGSSQSARS